jgi:hypothetical protein
MCPFYGVILWGELEESHAPGGRAKAAADCRLTAFCMGRRQSRGLQGHVCHSLCANVERGCGRLRPLRLVSYAHGPATQANAQPGMRITFFPPWGSAKAAGPGSAHMLSVTYRRRTRCMPEHAPSGSGMPPSRARVDRQQGRSRTCGVRRVLNLGCLCRTPVRHSGCRRARTGVRAARLAAGLGVRAQRTPLTVPTPVALTSTREYNHS